MDDQDGGEPGGNIRVGFLFRTDRGLAFTDRAGGCSTCATTVANGPSGVELSFSPGRIDPTNSAFNNSRKPLAGEFTFSGQKLFLIANHFNSKGGDDPLFGRFQPPVLSSETQRNQQAQIVNNFVDSILALNASAKIVVLGDLNDFHFSTPINTLKGGVLNALIETLPEGERYTYVFEGNAQALDHILVSNGLFSGLFDYDVVHVNAEFADQISDHDPQVVRLTLTGSGTPTPTPTVTPSPSSTVTPTPTLTPTPTPTLTPTPTPTPTPSIPPSPTPSCPPAGPNQILDSTFEAGSPWPAWTVQTSTNFGTPICNAGCGTGGGTAGGFGGSVNWVWFGGTATAETATTGQSVAFGIGGSATLTFQLWIGSVSAPFTDVLNVRVDGTIVASFPEPAVAEPGYTLRTVNVGAFANGASHAILFEYIGPGGAVSNFSVDNVILIVGGTLRNTDANPNGYPEHPDADADSDSDNANSNGHAEHPDADSASHAKSNLPATGNTVTNSLSNGHSVSDTDSNPNCITLADTAVDAGDQSLYPDASSGW